MKHFLELKGIEYKEFCGLFFSHGKLIKASKINREDPCLIKVVEELDYLANGRKANLYIEEFTDSVKYKINNFKGLETVNLCL